MDSTRRAVDGRAQELRTRFLRGLVRLFVLHSAMQGPVHGWTLRKTLQAWGSQISTGGLYPLLHALERDGLLHSYTTGTEGRERKYYQITKQGRICYTRMCRNVAPVVREIFFEPTIGAN